MAAIGSMTEAQARAESASGGEILARALRDQGVERIFCIPGESYLPVLDGLYDLPEIAVISARHEGAAANMAEAHGKLTGRPGIVFATRGPGATHAAIGVHTAFQDSTPMILFIGQVARNCRDREGFQEVDYRAMFAPLAKWVAEIDDPARIPEYVSRAFHTAMAGRPGPVVLALPEDMLAERVARPPRMAPAVAPLAAPARADLDAMTALLAEAERPLIVVGGTGWTDKSCSDLRAFATQNDLPIVSSFRRQDLIDNRAPIYCGHLGLGVDPALAGRMRSADLIVAAGSRLGENTTGGYSLLSSPDPAQCLIHIHPDPEELGRVFRPTLAINASLATLGDAFAGRALPASPERRAWLEAARQAYLDFSTPTPRDGDWVDLGETVAWLSDHLPDDAIVTNGAGNYTVWVHRYYRYRGFRTELAPISGAMGYGVPAAIAAKLQCPERQVVAFAGDGCFLMYPQELATAVQHRANLVILVVNNGTYGTIRMHQERRYPGRVIATDLRNPDFAALAQSFGAYGEKVDRTADFPSAFHRATTAGRPALLELRVDPNQITPAMRLPPRL